MAKERITTFVAQERFTSVVYELSK